MPKKIESVSDLPEWFHAAEYSVTANFSPIEWLIHLRRRRVAHMLQTMVSNYEAEWSTEFRELLREHCNEALTEIRAELTKRFSEDCDFKEHAPNLYLFGRRPGPSIQQAIRHPTMQELSDFISYLPRSISAGINHSSRHPFDYGELFPEHDEYGAYTPYWIDPEVWWHEPAFSLVSDELGSFLESDSQFANHLIIDINQSDEALRESFETILKTLRARHPLSENERANKGKIQFDKWSRYSIIPYLDLEQWCAENNVFIPNKVYSSALSKFRPIVGDDNIRKTIKPAARSAITRSTLMRLESFVASNIEMG